MRKAVFFGFLVFYLIFVSSDFFSAFAQGIEWQRIRTGRQEQKIRTDIESTSGQREWQRVRTTTTQEEKIRTGEETTVAGRAPRVEYFIASGDVLQIFVWQNPDVRITMAPVEESHTPEETSSLMEYLITSGDVIEIFVWQNPDLTRIIRVGPDGKISHPLIGRIQAVDLTIGQLEERITQDLSKYVKYPEVSVMINKFMGDEAVVLDREAIVGPDGDISYPLVGRIEAVGLSIRQLEEKIKGKLPNYLKYSQASVVVKKSTGNKIIVLGEVAFPGVYTYAGSINVVEAIALAGDFTNDAKKRSVMIVRGGLKENAEVARINVARVFRKGTPEANLTLQSNDVIYVPKTFIANWNEFLTNLTPTIEKAENMFSIRSEIRRWHLK